MEPDHFAVVEHTWYGQDAWYTTIGIYANRDDAGEMCATLNGQQRYMDGQTGKMFYVEQWNGPDCKTFTENVVSA